MARSINGKVVIVTGASSGIGRATSLALARENARLVLVARRQPLLDQLQSEIAGIGGMAVAMPLDLTRPENVETMIRESHAQFGRIDVLINNAGFGYFGTVENTPRPVAREIFALNFDAPLIAIQQVIPIMREQGGGHIINVASVAGKRGLPLSGVYCSTKFALDGLSQALRLELRGTGIAVTLVNPAATATDFFDEARRSDVRGRFKPLGYVQPAEDVAAAIVRCIRRPVIEVFPYRTSRLLVWANALAPSLVDRIMVPYLRDRIRAKSTA